MTFDVSKMVSFDLETHLIQPGILAPKIVCGSAAWRMSDSSVDSCLYDRSIVLEQARGFLDSRIIVGANIAYDFGCLAAADPRILPLIFKAYAEGRVYDVQIAQALHAIAEGNLYIDPRTGIGIRGRYSLALCVALVLGREDAKVNDEWRLRYAELEDVPIAQWPETARQYPIDDAVNTLEVAIAQIQGPHRNLGDLSNQVEAAFDLHLGAIWGLRTDAERVAELEKKTELSHAEFVRRFEALGFYADGKKDTKAVKRAVIKAYGGEGPCPARCARGKILSAKTGSGINCPECSGTGLDTSAAPRTAGGGVSADRDSLVESGDFDLAALGDNEPEKIRDTYLPFLKEGIERPISLRPNVLVASGRTSYDGLIQLMPRAGGVRDAFRARPGYVYCSVDFAALELCTLAQVCLWIFKKSQMAETINATGDPGSLHTAFAASLAGVTPEQMTTLVKAKDENAKKFRQAAKAGNFGFPGGMGAAKFVFAKRKKSEGTTETADGTEYPGIRFCVLLRGAERCGEVRVTEWRGRPTPPICRACVTVVDEVLRPAWFKQWPEIREYHDWVSMRVDGGGELPCFGTDRVRGGLEFTSGANNGFQALASDGAKNALRKLVREAYLDRNSAVYGTRPIFFAHDEIFSEIPEATAYLAGPRKAEIMVSAMREYVPDVAVRAEPALMRWWDKSAEPAFKNDRLIPWEDR